MNCICPFERTHSKRPAGRFFVGAKYPMRINEFTHEMPTFQAQLKVSGSTVITRLQAANIQQARALLVHLYGAANVVALTLVSE
jgi:hypothetical protein